ncbi:MAG: response regulator transcription factor [bacterium]
MKVLIVEDNIELGNDLSDFLKEQGFIAEIADNLAIAKEKCFIYQYDLVVLDLGLPDGNGLDLIKDLKSIGSDTGILIVTAKNALDDKVKGLELGADDYLTKPFHKAELNARIRSILRRNKFKGQNIIQSTNIKINMLSLEVHINDELTDLTKKEFDLLIYLIDNKNRVLTKESIVEHLWGDHADQSENFDFIYNHIKNLRKKLSKKGADVQIKSVYGMGYKYLENNDKTSITIHSHKKHS